MNTNETFNAVSTTAGEGVNKDAENITHFLYSAKHDHISGMLTAKIKRPGEDECAVCFTALSDKKDWRGEYKWDDACEVATVPASQVVPNSIRRVVKSSKDHIRLLRAPMNPRAK